MDGERGGGGREKAQKGGGGVDRTEIIINYIELARIEFGKAWMMRASFGPTV